MKIKTAYKLNELILFYNHIEIIHWKPIKPSKLQ